VIILQRAGSVAGSARTRFDDGPAVANCALDSSSEDMYTVCDRLRNWKPLSGNCLMERLLTSRSIAGGRVLSGPSLY
jgi:hypothetical protein